MSGNPDDNLDITSPLSQTRESGGKDEDTDMEDYMHQFDTIAESNAKLSNIVEKFAKAEHDQERVSILINYVSVLQKQNDNLYDLLVQMNNIFGSK